MRYYKVGLSTPDEFYKNVIGKGFDEGYGMQCVAGFKEFTYSLCGRIVACNEGKAKCYADQSSEICALGFTKHSGRTLYNGDWVIFGGTEYGHVAMYYNGKYLGQNQNPSDWTVGAPFNLQGINMPILCCYRPNIYVHNTSGDLSRYTDEELAVKVMQGDFGNGQERIDKLGDRYAAVQKIVNQKIQNNRAVYYTIQSGDCLSVIADKYGTSVDQLCKWNNITNPNLIYPNTRIRVK